MKRYFEFNDENSAKFWEITLQGNVVTTRYGKVGSNGQLTENSLTTPEKAQEKFEKLIREKTNKGYLQKRINEPPYQIISWKEFEQKFSPAFEMPFEDFETSLAEIRLYKPNQAGNIHIEGDYFIDSDINAVFDGNLTVDGNIEMSCEGIGNFIYVSGNVKADSILLCEISSMDICGNADVKYGIMGMYGDDGGYLNISGDTTALVIVNDTYFNMHFSGTVNAVVIDTSYGDLEADFDQENLSEAILDELLDDEDLLDSGKVFNYLGLGKNILKKLHHASKEIPHSEPLGQQANGRKIPVLEALKCFPALREKIHCISDNNYNIYVYEDNTFLKGDLNLEEYEIDRTIGIIVNGNLTVEGTVENMEGDFGPFLLVLGDLKAKNIDKGGSEFYITGNCNVENVIYGYYNHGSMTVEGETRARFLIEDDHFFRLTKLHPDTVKINNYGDYGDFDYYSADISRVFVKEVLGNDGEEIDSTKFIGRLNNGQTVLKPGAKPSRLIVEENIAKIVQKGNEVTKLNLANKKLRQFPQAVLKIKTLKTLNLSGNPIGTIPDEITELVNLEELILDGCNLKELPESIGYLKNLRILDISNNNIHAEAAGEEDDVDDDYDDELDKGLLLPESIGKLAGLRILKMKYNKGFNLPQSLANLKGLEQLDVYQCSNARPIDFPEIICGLTGLKKLDIGSNSFKSIPESFLNLINLEELNLDSSLCYLSNLPDMSKLTKLKILHANGLISYTSRPYPNPKLLKYFFNIASLKELHIDRHGERQDTLNAATLKEIRLNLAAFPQRLQEFESGLTAKNGTWEITSHAPLAPDDFRGIGNLTELKVLDLSFNSLEKLPPEILQLKNLDVINLEYNCLSKAARQSIAAAFPTAKIDLTHQKTRNPEEEMHEHKQVAEFIKKGSDSSSNGNYIDALGYFDQALGYYDKGLATDEYNLIYIHYSKMYVYSKLAYPTSNVPTEAIRRHKESCMDEAQTCLELVPSNSNIWHFTDEGQFHQEVIRYACNVVAWTLYESHEDQEGLEKALAYAERGAAFASDPNYYYILDTKVRILLKLGRKDEAFRLVKKILRKEPNFADFKDFKTNTDYLEWEKNA